MTGAEKNHSKELDEDKDEDIEIRRRALSEGFVKIQNQLDQLAKGLKIDYDWDAEKLKYSQFIQSWMNSVKQKVQAEVEQKYKDMISKLRKAVIIAKLKAIHDPTAKLKAIQAVKITKQKKSKLHFEPEFYHV